MYDIMSNIFKYVYTKIKQGKEMEIADVIDANRILREIQRRYKGYKSRLAAVMSLFGLNNKELELYLILLKEQLKIKEICKRLELSERVVRRYIKEMLDRRFIERKVVEGKRLAYKYMSVSPAAVWKNVKLEMKKNISFIDENLVPELNEKNLSVMRNNTSQGRS